MKSKIILPCLAILLFACTQQTPKTLLVLHTNDTHSQVEPLSPGAKNGNKAGYARRYVLVDSLRRQQGAALLVDAGDFSQGTPYYNFYHGRVEVEALNKMQYDVVTLGNHEFDYGVDTLAAVLSQARFAVVCCNYDVSNTPLRNIVKPYVIVRKNGMKIGVTGVGVNPDGLIYDKNFEGIIYKEPYAAVNLIAQRLKEEERCDVVICLSHLGAEYKDESLPSDVLLAQQSRYIDAVIGGHTHAYMQKKVANVLGDSVPVVQAGKSGAFLGKLTLTIAH